MDDLVSDKCYQSFTIASLLPPNGPKNTLLTKEDHEAFNCLQTHSSSKKDPVIRAQELFKVVQKPLELFFEEKLSYYLQNIKEQPILRALCVAICHYGAAKESDFIDEFARHLQKPLNGND